MLLAVTALGYATVWLDGALRKDGLAERIGEVLNVPKDKIVRILLPLGIPNTPDTKFKIGYITYGVQFAWILSQV